LPSVEAIVSNSSNRDRRREEGALDVRFFREQYRTGNGLSEDLFVPLQRYFETRVGDFEHHAHPVSINAWIKLIGVGLLETAASAADRCNRYKLKLKARWKQVQGYRYWLLVLVCRHFQLCMVI